MFGISNDMPYVLTDNEVLTLERLAKRRYGKINRYHLDRSLDVIYSALEQWPRVFAVRVDLRFADDYRGEDRDSPICFQDADHKAITRFMDSLKCRLENHKYKGCQSKPVVLKYIWVKEQEGGGHPHYHLVLFFNKDVYSFRGKHTDPDAKNMSTRIQRAWCSALRLPYPAHKELVHFPRAGSYGFSRKSATLGYAMFQSFLIRVAYLCKVESKPLGDDKNNFGCSHAVRVPLPTNGIVLGL